MPIVTFNCWVDKSIYDLKTLHRVCYALAGDYSFSLALYSDGYQITAATHKTITEQEFRERFNQLLLDYALRGHISEETDALKAEILRKALTSIAR